MSVINCYNINNLLVVAVHNEAILLVTIDINYITFWNVIAVTMWLNSNTNLRQQMKLLYTFDRNGGLIFNIQQYT